MGLFNKLFGKSNNGNGDNTPPLTKTGELLNEDLYWQIIQESLEATETQDQQIKFLVDRLGQLTPTQIIEFKLRTEHLTNALYNPETWCAGYILKGGCSDDAFEYFRHWVTARGKEIYYQVKENPDSLADIIEENREQYEAEDYECEDLCYVGNDAFKNKTQLDIYDYMSDNAYSAQPDIQFTWEEDDPESMKALCPKLYEQYGE